MRAEDMMNTLLNRVLDLNERVSSIEREKTIYEKMAWDFKDENKTLRQKLYTHETETKDNFQLQYEMLTNRIEK